VAYAFHYSFSNTGYEEDDFIERDHDGDGHGSEEEEDDLEYDDEGYVR